MKMISWNVNGLRAALKKGFLESVASLDADVVCLQETKLQKGQCDIEIPGYESAFNFADRKGYSGTAVFSRAPLKDVRMGIGVDEHDHEGRVITCDFGAFYLVCCYTPNAQRELQRIEYRMRWEDDFRKYLLRLDSIKPVVLCGDLNVAHEEIDLKNPKTNHMSAGFSDQERGKFSRSCSPRASWTASATFTPIVDRRVQLVELHRRRARPQRRLAHRLLRRLRAPLASCMAGAKIHPEIMGSDHCPVELTIREADV